MTHIIDHTTDRGVAPTSPAAICVMTLWHGLHDKIILYPIWCHLDLSNLPRIYSMRTCESWWQLRFSTRNGSIGHALYTDSKITSTRGWAAECEAPLQEGSSAYGSWNGTVTAVPKLIICRADTNTPYLLHLVS